MNNRRLEPVVQENGELAAAVEEPVCARGADDSLRHVAHVRGPLCDEAKAGEAVNVRAIHSGKRHNRPCVKKLLMNASITV
jgi:hypothetical protein